MKKVLILEDEVNIRSFVVINLKRAGYDAIEAGTGAEALQRIRENPDIGVAILDVMLPAMNGFEVLKELRRRGLRLPIVMLSAKGMEQDKIMGLDLGADDYISKPFGIRELVARVRAVLRRHKSGQTNTLGFGCVEVDLDAQRVLKSGEEVPLTAQEFRLLRYLIEHPGRAITRQALIEGAWGFDYQGTARTVDNFVRNLRAKLEEDPEEPVYILTVRGVGYRFSAATGK